VIEIDPGGHSFSLDFKQRFPAFANSNFHLNVIWSLPARGNSS
jgi:hypothetical protein